MATRRAIALVLSCEHAGNEIPRRYRALFAPHRALLATHRGWDPGALGIARAIASRMDVPLIATRWSRLLVECNRSPGHRALFSAITAPLPDAEKRAIVDAYYTPHREAVRRAIAGAVRGGKDVVHVAVHTFTPELNDEVRNADIGLLYDPRRTGEVDVCRRWAGALREVAPALRVRRNYPYRGTADGLPLPLRREFGPVRYMGIELEVNQALAASAQGATRRMVTRGVVESLALAVERMG